MFSYLTNLEVYDSIIILTYLMVLLSAALFYFLIRRYNKKLAILTIPGFILLFSGKPFTAFTWGFWPSIAISIFFISLIYFINSKKDEKYPYVYIIILLMALIYTWTLSFAFFIIFLFIFYITQLLFKRINYNHIKKTTISIIISIILSLHYLLLFYRIWISSKRDFIWVTRESGLNSIYLSDFGYFFLSLLIIGIIFSTINLKRRLNKVTILGLSFIVIGYTNYLGAGKFAFQMRFLWPIFFAFFFAYGLYLIIGLLKIKKFVLLISVLFVFLFLGIPSHSLTLTYSPIKGGGLVNKICGMCLIGSL